MLRTLLVAMATLTAGCSVATTAQMLRQQGFMQVQPHPTNAAAYLVVLDVLWDAPLDFAGADWKTDEGRRSLAAAAVGPTCPQPAIVQEREMPLAPYGGGRRTQISYRVTCT